jgi:hypothetical protein
MRSLRPLRRVLVVAAAGGALTVGVPHIVPATPARADVGVRYGWGSGGGEQPPSGQGGPNTTTATATCGNGLIVLGPIVVPVVPNTTTVIQCQQAPPAAGQSR